MLDVENMTRIIEIADAINEVQEVLKLLDGGVVEHGTPIAKLTKIYDLIQKNANEKFDFSDDTTMDMFYNVIDNRRYSCEKRACYVVNGIF